MVALNNIQSFVDAMAIRFRPRLVILFGSYAYGNPNEDSDVDLMVIMPHRESGPQVATKIRLACPRDFPMDLIVRTPAEVRRLTKLGDSFLGEVLSRGIVLHESTHTLN